MAKILYGTTYIEESEPCFGLYEMNLQSPGSRGFHRYEIIYIIRDNKPAEFRRDLGLTKKFKHDEIRIPGGAIDETTGKIYIEHTVGELRDIANWIRSKPAFDKRELTKLDKIKG